MIDAIVGMLSQGIHPKEVAKAVVHAINDLKPKLRHSVRKDNSYEAIGLATYSNGESTV
jgi:hypothetical protein